MSRRFTPTADYLLFLHQLIQERRERNVSQEELATRLDLSPAQVAKYEMGERQLNFVQTREWCQALGVPFLEFMVRLDEEITAQLPDADADAPETPNADAAQTDADDPYGVGHHVLPHVPPAPAPDADAPEPEEGGAQ